MFETYKNNLKLQLIVIIKIIKITKTSEISLEDENLIALHIERKK